MLCEHSYANSESLAQICAILLLRYRILSTGLFLIGAPCTQSRRHTQTEIHECLTVILGVSYTRAFWHVSPFLRDMLL